MGGAIQFRRAQWQHGATGKQREETSDGKKARVPGEAGLVSAAQTYSGEWQADDHDKPSV